MAAIWVRLGFHLRLWWFWRAWTYGELIPRLVEGSGVVERPHFNKQGAYNNYHRIRFDAKNFVFRARLHQFLFWITMEDCSKEKVVLQASPQVVNQSDGFHSTA